MLCRHDVTADFPWEAAFLHWESPPCGLLVCLQAGIWPCGGRGLSRFYILLSILESIEMHYEAWAWPELAGLATGWRMGPWQEGVPSYWRMTSPPGLPG